MNNYENLAVVLGKSVSNPALHFKKRVCCVHYAPVSFENERPIPRCLSLYTDRVFMSILLDFSFSFRSKLPVQLRNLKLLSPLFFSFFWFKVNSEKIEASNSETTKKEASKECLLYNVVRYMACCGNWNAWPCLLINFYYEIHKYIYEQVFHSALLAFALLIPKH